MMLEVLSVIGLSLAVCVGVWGGGGVLLCTTTHYFSTEDKVQIDPQEGGLAGLRVGSQGHCHHHRHHHM